MAASAIPGLDVTEQWPIATRQVPNWTDPTGTLRGAPLPPPGSTGPGSAGPVVNGLRGGAYGAGRMLSRVAGAVRPLARVGTGVETLSHLGDYRIDDPDTDSSAAGTWNALRSGDFSGAGRSLSKGALEAGMDLGSAGARIADAFVPGNRPVSAAYNRMLRDNFGSQLVDNSGTIPALDENAGAGRGYINPPTVGQSQPVPSPAGAANLRDAGAGRGFINPPNAAAPQPSMPPITNPGLDPAQGRSIVTRDGNSFSGKDISGDIAYKDAKTGQITIPTDRVSVVPGVGNYSLGGGITAGGLRSGTFGGTDAALSAARQAAADRGDWGAVANSYAPAGGGNTNPYPTAEELGLRGRRADRYTQQMMGRMSMDTQRAINERNVELGLRGQDMTYAGHMASNRLGIFNALREQGNADRQYGLQAHQQDFTERGQREQQLQGNLEKMFTTMDGDKPVVNQQAVQQARQGFDRSIARLGLNGPHQLSPMDEQRLMAGTSLLQKMRENAGWLPWQPDKLKTIDPVDLVGMRVLPNGDRQIARKGSNAFGQVIPRRFFTTEEGSRMGDWFGTGTPTNRYDLLSMGQ